MIYIIATVEGQAKNSFGGRDFKKLGEVSAKNVAEAKVLMFKKFGAKATLLLPSEWEFMSNRSNDLRVKMMVSSQK